MGFGAEIAAKGPCSLRILARDRVQLEFGEVAVHVADWARGFTVVTPTMDVVDLGTTFVVSASQGSSSETSVIKGQVRVSPHKTVDGGPRSVLVSEGEALMVERSGRRTTLPSKPEETAAYIDFGDRLAQFWLWV
jgi:ferric-dicitrate binding protein FerR (iron transport regulator)